VEVPDWYPKALTRCCDIIVQLVSSVSHPEFATIIPQCLLCLCAAYGCKKGPKKKNPSNNNNLAVIFCSNCQEGEGFTQENI
jgi:hypothetical protein